MTLPRLSRPWLVWLGIVIVAFVGATALTALHDGGRVDAPMRIAANLFQGRPYLDQPYGTADWIIRGGRAYHVAGLGQLVPYLAFVPLPFLWPLAPWVISAVAGIVAAALAWPLADSYGPGGRATPWLATLAAFGTLLLPLSDQGNFYYLAHAEAVAATFVALIEWRGRRRAWVIGGAIAIAALARPTLLLAAIPFGAFLLLSGERRVRTLVLYAAPIAIGLAAMATWNFVRFGSPIESGYGLAVLGNTVLIKARAAGVFALGHIGDNLGVLLAGGFDATSRFPWIAPSPYGHSILLTTPAVVAAVNAGIRDRTAQLLWVAAGLVLVPVLLYYGGAGYITYGYRYAMDLMPFVLALVALGARRQFGGTEKALIVLSVAFCLFGVGWGITHGRY